MTETTQDTLDTSGLNCPLPVLKARKRLAGLPAGARLRLISTDPAAAADVPAFCEATGHLLIESDIGKDRLEFLIERKA